MPTRLHYNFQTKSTERVEISEAEVESKRVRDAPSIEKLLQKSSDVEDKIKAREAILDKLEDEDSYKDLPEVAKHKANKGRK